jgi:rRNA maturation protein Nop10
MKDLKLLETCPVCGNNITLMSSINTDADKTMLVKRCLSCGSYPLEEVAELANE